jgi:ribosomal protein L20A (L18A)
MEVKRRTKEELERAVEHVFAHFGSQFKMEF